MNTIIKVMGLPRSGTNAMNVMLNLNFEHYVCSLSMHYVDLFGWKHAKPIDHKVLKILENRTNNDIRFVFMYRDFEDWQSAILNRYSGESSGEFTNYSFGDDGFLFNTPMGAEYYDSLYEFYKNRVDSYKNFIEKHPKKSILVNYSELKNQNILLDKIKEHLDLNKSNENYILINKIVTFDNKITHLKQNI